jgi:hypothetical protein
MHGAFFFLCAGWTHPSSHERSSGYGVECNNAKHAPHQMRVRGGASRFERAMKVACEMEYPQALYARAAAAPFHLSLVKPVMATTALGAHPRFDLQAVVTGMRDALHYGAIPLVLAYTAHMGRNV